MEKWIEFSLYFVLLILLFLKSTETERLRNFHKPKGKIIFTLYIDSVIIKSSTMSVKINKSKFPIKGHIAPSTDNGAAEKVQEVAYTTDNESAVKIGPDPDAPDDTTKFQIDFGGTLGKANIGASADADLSDGVTTLTDTIEVEVVEDEATKLNMTLDVAEA